MHRNTRRVAERANRQLKVCLVEVSISLFGLSSEFTNGSLYGVCTSLTVSQFLQEIWFTTEGTHHLGD